MNRILILAFFYFITPIESLAQTPIIKWQKCLGGSNGDGSNQIVNVVVSNYTLLLGTNSIDGDVVGNHAASWDQWLVNIDTLGSINWQNCIGGSAFDYFFSSTVLLNGNILFCGQTFSNDGDVSGNHYPGTSDAWLVETDSLGNFIRQKCFGGTNHDGFSDFILLNEGEIIIVGGTSSINGDLLGTVIHGGNDIWVLKIDSSWNIIWQHRFGGSGSEAPIKIFNDSVSGGFLVCGQSESMNGDVTTPRGWEDYWIFKLDSSGNLLWDRSYGGSWRDYLTSAIACSNGAYILCGYSGSTDGDVTNNHGDQDNWIVKINSIGDILWQKCYGGSGLEYVNTIAIDFDNNYILVGTSSSIDGDVTGVHGGGCFPGPCDDIWIVKIDTIGNIIWQKCMGGSSGETGSDILSVFNNEYLVLGGGYSTDGDLTGSGNHGNHDAWIVKLSNQYVGQQEMQNSTTDFSLYYNLSNETFDVNFYANGNEKLNLQLFDITGRVLLQQPLAVTEGFNKHHIPAGKLSSGIYLVRLMTEHGAVTKKLIVH